MQLDGLFSSSFIPISSLSALMKHEFFFLELVQRKENIPSEQFYFNVKKLLKYLISAEF